MVSAGQPVCSVIRFAALPVGDINIKDLLLFFNIFKIPLVEYDDSDKDTPDYAFYDMSITLDDAVTKFKKVKDLIIKLSTVETSAYRLAASIKKTQKRANALQNITIPYYSTLAVEIENALEEKEREEFSRLKVIKQIQTKKNS